MGENPLRSMRSVPSADYPIQAPAVGDTFHLVLAGVFDFGLEASRIVEKMPNTQRASTIVTRSRSSRKRSGLVRLLDRRSSRVDAGSPCDASTTSSSVGPPRSPAAAIEVVEIAARIALQADAQRRQDRRVWLRQTGRHLDLGQRLLGPSQEPLVIGALAIAGHVADRTANTPTGGHGRDCHRAPPRSRPHQLRAEDSGRWMRLMLPEMRPFMKTPEAAPAPRSISLRLPKSRGPPGCTSPTRNGAFLEGVVRRPRGGTAVGSLRRPRRSALVRAHIRCNRRLVSRDPGAGPCRGSR